MRRAPKISMVVTHNPRRSFVATFYAPCRFENTIRSIRDAYESLKQVPVQQTSLLSWTVADAKRWGEHGGPVGIWGGPVGIKYVNLERIAGQPDLSVSMPYLCEDDFTKCVVVHGRKPEELDSLYVHLVRTVYSPERAAVILGEKR